MSQNYGSNALFWGGLSKYWGRPASVFINWTCKCNILQWQFNFRKIFTWWQLPNSCCPQSTNVLAPKLKLPGPGGGNVNYYWPDHWYMEDKRPDETETLHLAPYLWLTHGTIPACYCVTPAIFVCFFRSHLHFNHIAQPSHVKQTWHMAPYQPGATSPAPGYFLLPRLKVTWNVFGAQFNLLLANLP